MPSHLFSFDMKMETRPTLTLGLAFWENCAVEKSRKFWLGRNFMMRNAGKTRLSRMYKNTESQRCPGGFQSWEATHRLWFSILAWMRRVGAESLFWQQLMWCETAFNDTRSTSKSYFIWHLRFVFHQTWWTISVILGETKRVLCLTQSTFLLTGRIAKCVVADPRAK